MDSTQPLIIRIIANSVATKDTPSRLVREVLGHVYFDQSRLDEKITAILKAHVSNDWIDLRVYYNGMDYSGKYKIDDLKMVDGEYTCRLHTNIMKPR